MCVYFRYCKSDSLSLSPVFCFVQECPPFQDSQSEAPLQESKKKKKKKSWIKADHDTDNLTPLTDDASGTDSQSEADRDERKEAEERMRKKIQAVKAEMLAPLRFPMPPSAMRDLRVPSILIVDFEETMRLSGLLRTPQGAASDASKDAQPCTKSVGEATVAQAVSNSEDNPSRQPMATNGPCRHAGDTVDALQLDSDTAATDASLAVGTKKSSLLKTHRPKVFLSSVVSSDDSDFELSAARRILAKHPEFGGWKCRRVAPKGGEKPSRKRSSVIDSDSESSFQTPAKKQCDESVRTSSPLIARSTDAPLSVVSPVSVSATASVTSSLEGLNDTLDGDGCTSPKKTDDESAASLASARTRPFLAKSRMSKSRLTFPYDTLTRFADKTYPTSPHADSILSALAVLSSKDSDSSQAECVFFNEAKGETPLSDLEERKANSEKAMKALLDTDEGEVPLVVLGHGPLESPTKKEQRSKETAQEKAMKALFDTDEEEVPLIVLGDGPLESPRKSVGLSDASAVKRDLSATGEEPSPHQASLIESEVSVTAVPSKAVSVSQRLPGSVSACSDSADKVIDLTKQSSPCVVVSDERVSPCSPGRVQDSVSFTTHSPTSGSTTEVMPVSVLSTARSADVTRSAWTTSLSELLRSAAEKMPSSSAVMTQNGRFQPTMASAGTTPSPSSAMSAPASASKSQRHPSVEANLVKSKQAEASSQSRVQTSDSWLVDMVQIPSLTRASSVNKSVVSVSLSSMGSQSTRYHTGLPPSADGLSRAVPISVASNLSAHSVSVSLASASLVMHSIAKHTARTVTQLQSSGKIGPPAAPAAAGPRADVLATAAQAGSSAIPIQEGAGHPTSHSALIAAQNLVLTADSAIADRHAMRKAAEMASPSPVLAPLPNGPVASSQGTPAALERAMPRDQRPALRGPSPGNIRLVWCPPPGGQRYKVPTPPASVSSASSQGSIGIPSSGSPQTMVGPGPDQHRVQSLPLSVLPRPPGPPVPPSPGSQAIPASAAEQTSRVQNPRSTVLFEQISRRHSPHKSALADSLDTYRTVTSSPNGFRRISSAIFAGSPKLTPGAGPPVVHFRVSPLDLTAGAGHVSIATSGVFQPTVSNDSVLARSSVPSTANTQTKASSLDLSATASHASTASGSVCQPKMSHSSVRARTSAEPAANAQPVIVETSPSREKSSPHTAVSSVRSGNSASRSTAGSVSTPLSSALSPALAHFATQSSARQSHGAAKDPSVSSGIAIRLDLASLLAASQRTAAGNRPTDAVRNQPLTSLVWSTTGLSLPGQGPPGPSVSTQHPVPTLRVASEQLTSVPPLLRFGHGEAIPLSKGPQTSSPATWCSAYPLQATLVTPDSVKQSAAQSTPGQSIRRPAASTGLPTSTSLASTQSVVSPAQVVSVATDGSKSPVSPASLLQSVGRPAILSVPLASRTIPVTTCSSSTPSCITAARESPTSVASSMPGLIPLSSLSTSKASTARPVTDQSRVAQARTAPAVPSSLLSASSPARSSSQSISHPSAPAFAVPSKDHSVIAASKSSSSVSAVVSAAAWVGPCVARLSHHMSKLPPGYAYVTDLSQAVLGGSSSGDSDTPSCEGLESPVKPEISLPSAENNVAFSTSSRRANHVSAETRPSYLAVCSSGSQPSIIVISDSEPEAELSNPSSSCSPARSPVCASAGELSCPAPGSPLCCSPTMPSVSLPIGIATRIEPACKKSTPGQVNSSATLDHNGEARQKLPVSVIQLNGNTAEEVLPPASLPETVVCAAPVSSVSSVPVQLLVAAATCGNGSESVPAGCSSTAGTEHHLSAHSSGTWFPESLPVQSSKRKSDGLQCSSDAGTKCHRLPSASFHHRPKLRRPANMDHETSTGCLGSPGVSSAKYMTANSGNRLSNSMAASTPEGMSSVSSVTSLDSSLSVQSQHTDLPAGMDVECPLSDSIGASPSVSVSSQHALQLSSQLPTSASISRDTGGDLALADTHRRSSHSSRVPSRSGLSSARRAVKAWALTSNVGMERSARERYAEVASRIHALGTTFSATDEPRDPNGNASRPLHVSFASASQLHHDKRRLAKVRCIDVTAGGSLVRVRERLSDDGFFQDGHHTSRAEDQGPDVPVTSVSIT